MVKIEPPPVWDKSTYIRPIQTTVGGLRAFTHLAELRPPGIRPCRAYVKHFAPTAHRCLFNEWFGYTFMQAMGVPQPKAGFVLAPVHALPGAPLQWGFASCQPSPMFEGTPVQLYNLANPEQHKALAKRLLACTAMPLLIAVDQLVKNGDRNMGNLVFTGKTGFVAIDHSDILGGPAWALTDTHFTQRWEICKPIELVAAVADLKNDAKSAILASAQLVSQQLFELQAQFGLALGAHCQTDVSAALAMVWWRALELEKWFKHKLGLMT